MLISHNKKVYHLKKNQKKRIYSILKVKYIIIRTGKESLLYLSKAKEKCLLAIIERPTILQKTEIEILFYIKICHFYNKYW